MASDFGSDYRTHTHITSEALYASLTKGATWRPRLIDLKNDAYSFIETYDVPKMPIWFLPGLFFADEGSYRLPDDYLDTSTFNVVSESYPSTSKCYIFKKGLLAEKPRPYHVPTYGRIQAIKPDRRMLTYVISASQDLLETFAEGQTFVLGKKRTMFQIVSLSSVIEGQWMEGICSTGWLELPPTYGCLFQQFQILAATMRYLILKGLTKEKVKYIEFQFDEEKIRVPDFYWDQISRLLGVENKP